MRTVRKRRPWGPDAKRSEDKVNNTVQDGGAIVHQKDEQQPEKMYHYEYDRNKA